MTQTQALVARSSTDIAGLDELDMILRTGEVNAEVIDDPDQISKSIIDQLLGAETDEQLQDFGNAQGWKNLIGVPIELRGFRWRQSDFEEGAPIYFIVAGTRLDTGEQVTLTTGSLNVLAQLSNMARRQTLAGSVWQLHQSDKPTKSNFYPMWLVQPEAVKQAARDANAAASNDQPAPTPEPATDAA